MDLAAKVIIAWICIWFAGGVGFVIFLRGTKNGENLLIGLALIALSLACWLIGPPR